MVTYKPIELKRRIIDSFEYVDNTFGSIENILYFDDDDNGLGTILSKSGYVYDDIDDNIDNNIEITDDTIISLELDETHDMDIYVDIKLSDFFEVIDSFKTITKFTNDRCISKKQALFRVLTFDSREEYLLDSGLDGHNGFKNDIFKFKSIYHGKEVSCSVVRGITLFALKVVESGDYDEYNPPFQWGEYFVRVQGDDLSEHDFYNIASSYLFELSAGDIVNLHYSPRVEYLDLDTDDLLENFKIMRPLMFGKGITDIVNLFNKANCSVNIDLKIINLAKVLEYVSQTVIRLEKTERIQNKLNSNRVMKADADYIRELEKTFDEIKDKYTKDSDAIKATVKRCCDIEDIIDDVPEYMKKIYKLKEELLKDKVNREALINSAQDEIADSISDTRNQISHAKANYTIKGKECPEEYKEQFVIMLRKLAIQTIRWYSSIHEDQRITNEN